MAEQANDDLTDYSQFRYTDEEAIDEQLKCPICQNVMEENPVVHHPIIPTNDNLNQKHQQSTAECGRMFCQKCVKGVQGNKQGQTSCPFCRQAFTRETLFPAPLSIRNKLDELKTICVFCYVVMKRENRISHKGKCNPANQSVNTLKTQQEIENLKTEKRKLEEQVGSLKRELKAERVESKEKIKKLKEKKSELLAKVKQHTEELGTQAEVNRLVWKENFQLRQVITKLQNKVKRLKGEPVEEDEKKDEESGGVVGTKQQQQAQSPSQAQPQSPQSAQLHQRPSQQQ